MAAPLVMGTWSAAVEIEHESSLRGHQCRACGGTFRIGQWVRTLYGPRGGRNYHDDCTDAHTGDQAEYR